MLLRKIIRKTISSTFLNNECIFYQVPKDLLLKEGFSNWSYSCQKIIQCRLQKWDSSQRFITQILTNLDVFAWIFSKVTPKTFYFEKIDFSRFPRYLSTGSQPHKWILKQAKQIFSSFFALSDFPKFWITSALSTVVVLYVKHVVKNGKLKIILTRVSVHRIVTFSMFYKQHMKFLTSLISDFQ